MANRQKRRRNKKLQNADYRKLLQIAKTYRSEGAYREAELAFQEALGADNTEAEPYHILALMAYENGNLETAGNQIIEATMRAENDATIHADCGAIMNMLGRSAEAEAACRHAIDLNPDYIEAYNNLAVALSQQNRLEEAIQICDTAIECRPDYADALINKGNFLVHMDDPVSAIETFTMAIKIAPNNPLARVNLGTALRLVGELDAAQKQCEAGLALRPDYPEAHAALGMILAGRGDYEDAQTAFSTALKYRPSFGAAQINLAAAKFKTGDLHAAENEYSKVIAAHPNAASALTGLGVVLLAKGELDDAHNSFRKAVELDPSEGEAWMNLASALGRDFSIADREKLITLSEDKGLKLEKRIGILFALGEVADNKGEYADAFKFFKEANEARKEAMKKLDKTYDPYAMDELAEAIIAEFPETEPNCQSSSNSRQPVFVVGMPRSGTTLVEQIIASHSDAESQGEAQIISSLLSDFPRGLKNAKIEQLTEKALLRLPSAIPRVVDKSPFQFMHVGLIRRIFPKASIIFCQRDKTDLGMSCYFQNFVTDYPWSTDLENIGRFIAFHDRLVAYWQALYGGNIHTISYEALIADPEVEIRSLIDYIGLPWDPACLSFHINKNAVFTASNWQVRRPIFNTSVNRSQFYKPYLEPLYAGINVND